ncbi:hypothetical protein H6G81_17025 [Scytonema hofmannii FACHB-248]|uniref:Uncharacterized protein n=1 Tax=Scytonema hofmannii FACHB-248 TaxID=1842502 RepID=A0ABR8GS41_9CYAN|nr:hypothetical protein [Scytonema hofmannii FACHB-248]
MAEIELAALTCQSLHKRIPDIALSKPNYALGTPIETTLKPKLTGDLPPQTPEQNSNACTQFLVIKVY